MNETLKGKWYQNPYGPPRYAIYDQYTRYLYIRPSVIKFEKEVSTDRGRVTETYLFTGLTDGQ